MNYSDTLAWMFNQLPMYQRLGASAYKADLNNTIQLLDLLNQPQKSFRAIHIAGTNGKGSVSHMIAAVLQEAGYKTGLYTSPHLKDFRERIRINGVMIPEEKVVEFIAVNKSEFERMKLSFFEMTVGMAFRYFADEQVDLAVIETGMGGRLDSTNLAEPVLSVITNIGYDHTQFLGDTLPKIAAEKAGIIKPGVPVIIGETQTEVKAVFEEEAHKVGSPWVFADEMFEAKRIRQETVMYQQFDIWKNSEIYYEALKLSLLGLYQQMNLVTAVCALDQLKTVFPWTERNLWHGMAQVSKLTGLKGRWQVIGRMPLCVVDTGHNEAGIRQNMMQLSQLPCKQLHIVLGVVNDKIMDGILQLLPSSAQYYFCRPDIPRGLDAELLSEQAFKFGLRGEVYRSVSDAYRHAREIAGSSDIVFVGGSTFVVAEVL
ncbi:MAG: bifunctional folylpolyglutamate synthase/dihydrofolate synthase [Bacteroidales bacterium]|nr:bifunctional folylpolyglutamate synthase/dihydrofolate synthase [Bacteroidales bacterium]